MHTIAVVEDDRMLNEALARMLQKNGYQVTRAHTLAEGRKLAAGGPDLMIVDIGLPDGDRLVRSSRPSAGWPGQYVCGAAGRGTAGLFPEQFFPA